MGTAVVRRHHFYVSVLLLAITVLELDPCVRETHSVAVAGKVVVLRPCGNLFGRPVGSAGAVGAPPVPLLQEVLVLAFELVVEDDALDASALVTNLRLDVAGRAVDLCVVGQLARLLEARVERLPRLASVLTPIRFEQVSASIREHDDVLVPSLQPGALQQTGRQKMIEAPLRGRLASLLAAHEHAFAHFGGRCAELLYDRMRTVVLGTEDGKPVWNATFEAFAKHWGFEPRLCRPYRAQTKGKVESGVKYVKRNFVPGRVFRVRIPTNVTACTEDRDRRGLRASVVFRF